MTHSLTEIIERKRQLVAEIAAKQNEVATIDRMIENAALCSARAVEENGQPDFSMFKEETLRLLTAFWHAPEKLLFREDIRQNVILDNKASDGAIRQAIDRAKKALQEVNFPYDIKNIRGKGYKLVNRAEKSVTKRSKKDRKRRNTL
jgi:DNA-binding winged helix-turn-helix (wHTH) protein